MTIDEARYTETYRVKLDAGLRAEHGVLRKLRERSRIFRHAYRTRGPHTDIRLDVGFEVKDNPASERTGNVAIEVGNRHGEPDYFHSTADYWVFVVYPNGEPEAIVVPFAALRAHLWGLYRPTVPGGNGKLSDLIVLSIAELMAIAGACNLGPITLGGGEYPFNDD